MKKVLGTMPHLFACLFVVTTYSSTLLAQKTPTTVKTPVTTEVAATMPANKAISFTKADYLECFAFTAKLDKKVGLDENLKTYNAFLLKRFGITKTLSAEQVKNFFYRKYQSNAGSVVLMLDYLKKDKKISEALYTFSKEFDRNLLNSKTNKDALVVVQSTQRSLAAGKYSLSALESARMTNFLIHREALIEYRMLGGGTETTFPCTISFENEWEAGADGDMPTLLSSMIMLSEGPCGTGGGGGDIPNEPYNHCPKNYTYDGANCSSGIYAPVGSTAFIFNGGFYYTPMMVSNAPTCPIGGTFDGLNCFHSPIPTSFNGFIWSNMFYVQSKYY